MNLLLRKYNYSLLSMMGELFGNKKRNCLGTFNPVPSQLPNMTKQLTLLTGQTAKGVASVSPFSREFETFKQKSH